MNFAEIVQEPEVNLVFPVRSWCAISHSNPRVFKSEGTNFAYTVIRQPVYNYLNQELKLHFAPYKSSVRGRENLWRYFEVNGTMYTLFVFSQPDIGMFFKLRWS